MLQKIINITEIPLVLTCHNTFHVVEIWRRGLGTACSLDHIHVLHHPESEKMQPFQWPPETPGWPPHWSTLNGPWPREPWMCVKGEDFIQHLFTLILFFILWNTKQDFEELTSIVFFVYILKVNGNWNGLVSNILQNIFLRVPQKKVILFKLFEHPLEASWTPFWTPF